MRNPSTLTLLAAMALIAGCNDTTEPGAAVPVSFADAAAAANAGVVERVQGGANFTAPDGDLRTFAFSAVRYADGSVTGQWERIRRFGGNAASNKSHGVVTCFTVIGNNVWLGGYATSGNFTEPGFNEVGWSVVDNGNGRNAPPDQMSLQRVARIPGFADRVCDQTPDFFLFDIAAGNIIIH